MTATSRDDPAALRRMAAEAHARADRGELLMGHALGNDFDLRAIVAERQAAPRPSRQVYVAHLDTAGISYAAAEYAAAASTEEGARQAVYDMWDASPARGDHPQITDPEALHEWFGITVWTLPLDGGGMRVD